MKAEGPTTDPRVERAYCASAGRLLMVYLVDGRALLVPLEWFPRLKDARDEDLQKVRITDEGRGLRWDTLDEDLSVRRLLWPATN